MTERRSLMVAALLGVIGLLVGLGLVAALTAPRVVSISPEDGSQSVPSTSGVRITFSRAMDAASVETRLQFDPEMAGRWIWEGNTLSFEPDRSWPEGSTVTIRLRAGARSTRVLPTLRSYEWSFVVGVPRIAYLWPTGSEADLYIRSLEGDRTDRLTEAAQGVADFSLSADGTLVLYGADRADGGTDLRLLDVQTLEERLLYACPEGSRCRLARLAPDGRMAVFELTEGLGPAGAFGPAQLWAVPIDGGAAFRVGAEEHITGSPRWSPTGVLAYYDNTLRAIVLAELGPEATAGVLRYIPSELGVVGSWAPDGGALVFPEMIFPPEPTAPSGLEQGVLVAFYSHLMRADMGSPSIADLWSARDGQVEDTAPVHSPDGRWIAFARKHLDRERWTLGRQLWVMRADGAGAHALTDDPLFNHSAFAWSPDSRWLAYMRFNESDPTQAPEIWVIGLDGEPPRQLSVGGYLPQWLP